MRLISVCDQLALSAVFAFLIAVFSATRGAPLLDIKECDVEFKQEQQSSSSDSTLGPGPLAKRADINDLVSKSLGQGYAHFGADPSSYVIEIESQDMFQD